MIQVRATERLNAAKFAKAAHQLSRECPGPHNCSTCSMWFGYIQGLNELIMGYVPKVGILPTDYHEPRN
jgi:hypothetical protein